MTPSCTTMWWWPTGPDRSRTGCGGHWIAGACSRRVVTLSELHQGVLSDLLTEGAGVGVGRPDPPPLRPAPLRGDRGRRSSDGRVLPALGGHRERKNALVAEFVAARGRQPTTVEVLDLRRRATLETRPDKTHRSLAEMTGEWRQRAEPLRRSRPTSWVAALADRNDLPLLRAGDLADEILADAADVAAQRVAERRATFSRANIMAEVHRQLHGVRFASRTTGSRWPNARPTWPGRSRC